MSKAYVLLSGGMDSTTCLAAAIHRFSAEEVTAVSVDYGQRHRKELEHAIRIADFYGAEWSLLDLSVVIGVGGLTDENLIIPHKAYAELPDGISPTYVPFRNGLMLAALASKAQADPEANHIYYGAHAEDAENDAYPDCSIDFINAINVAIRIGTYEQISLSAPLASMTKVGVVEYGTSLGVPWEMTWSCYEGNELHCGECPTCQSRIMAFGDAGVEDPTEYANDQ